MITSISLLIGEYYLTLSGLCFRKLCLEQTPLTLLKTKSVGFLIMGLFLVGLVMTSDIVNYNVFGKEPGREYISCDLECF